MKKLEKLTLKEMRTNDRISICDNPNRIIGGEDPDLSMMSAPGWADYLDKYGESLPENTSYDPYTDTCSYWDPNWGQQESIGSPSGQTYSECYWDTVGDIALGLVGTAYIAGCIAFSAVFTTFPDTGSLIPSPTNFEQENTTGSY